MNTENPTSDNAAVLVERPLRRSTGDRMIAGVAGGIADHLGVDVTIVRIVIAVLAVVGGFGIPLYLAAWLLIPEEGCDRCIAAELIGDAHRPSA